MSDHQHDNANVSAPPPLIYAAGLVLGLLLQRAKAFPLLLGRTGRIIGACLIVLNFLVSASAAITMRRARTSLDPREPTTMIVSSGPFRYTRNPIYLSFTILYAGISLMANTVWPLLLLPGVLLTVNRGVIDREEQYLERKFGAEYTRYKSQVRRWL